MSWVISLGAGKEQIPLIRAIQAEGHSCVAFDVNPAAPGADISDAFMAISNRDHETICAEVGPMDVGGVMAAGSEVPDVMAILAYRLNLPGIPVAAGTLLKDKLAYKKVLRAASIPHTEAHVVYAGSIKALFDQLKHEVVVKPQVGSGSRGVTLVRHAPMELDHACLAAEDVCPDVIMERYQPGPQISAETLIWDGFPITVAFVDRFYESFGKELGGSAPSEWESERAEANLLIGNAARALGILNGTIKSDLVLTEGGPVIIEMTCRLSGGPLGMIVKEHSGIDYFRQAVRIACGDEPRWDEMMQTKNERIAVDMNGDRIDWGWSRKFIVKELGEVAR